MLQRLLSLFITLGLISSALAQFSYDFDGTTEDYFTYSTEGIGFLSSATTLNVFKTFGTSVDDDDAILLYDHATQLNEDWFANVTVNMPSPVSGFVLNDQEQVEIGISLFVPADADGSTIDLRLAVDNPMDNPSPDRFFFSEYEDGYGNPTVTTEQSTADLTATLSIDYDFGTGILTAAYDGNTLTSHNLFDGSTGWDVTTESWVHIAINAGAEGIDELTANEPSFTNFTTSVVPEPSTYAAVLGAIVLAGTAMRRRHAA